MPTPVEVEAIAQNEQHKFQSWGPEGATLKLDDDVIAFEEIRIRAREELGRVRSGVDPKSTAGPAGVTVEQVIELHINEPRKKGPLAPVP
ncbi:MAG: hypothetical protein ACREDO_11865 [Methyloceanibacter sp.]